MKRKFWKMSEENVRDARELYKLGIKPSKIARFFKVSQSWMGKILKGERR